MSIVNKPFTFSPNTSISSSQMNSNFDDLYDDYNGGISAANLANNAVTTDKIADDNVTAAKIADGAIDAAAKISTGVVTPEKLTAGTGTSWAWQDWTPTITATTGSFTTTSAAGRYTQIGKTVHFQVAVTITTVGTGTGAKFSLPVTAQSAIGTIGGYRERAVSGLTGTVSISTTSTAIFHEYDNVQTIASGWVFQAYGTYEAA